MNTSPSSTAARVRRLLPALAAVAVVALWSTAAWACPGCKDALETSEGGGDLKAGFFWSILFMLSMPPLILLGLGTAMYRAVRRARAAQAAGQPLPPSVGAPLPVTKRDASTVSPSIGTAG